MICSIATESNSTVILKRKDLLPGIYLVKVLNNMQELYTQKLIVAAE